MLDTKLGTYLLLFYKKNFLEILSFINQLLDNLMKNILLLPNSIKYICKIISALIKKKFKNITKIEENAFISKFIIQKLLIPIIASPSNYALITEFVISRNTLKNIEVMNLILQKLFSGKLFLNDSKEGNYTPFNWFFMDKMEKILYFFEKIINVNLPNFIEKYINDELPKDYYYDYFNENPDEICTNISICFTIDNLNCLVKGLEKGNNIFNDSKNSKVNKLRRSFSKLNSQSIKEQIKAIDEKILKDLLKTLEKANNGCEIQIYYLYNELEIEKKYQFLFSINNKNANFYINIKKLEKNESLDEQSKNIIKVKNYLCSSLGNYRLLNNSDFDINSTSNTIKMLNEIKIYMSLPNFILNNNTIPSIWYINSLIDYLEKLPEEYKTNDYKKLFKELAQNINDSINSLDFEILIFFRNKLKFIDKMTSYYENVKQLKNNIIINENIKLIAENAFIPVDMIFKYEKEEKKFELQKSNLKEKIFENKIIYKDPKKKYISTKTIEAFIRYFPNLTNYQKQGINPLKVIEELSINIKINSYFDIIKEKIIKKKLLEINKYDSLYNEKIKDYIMTKIYPKIYPPYPNEDDKKIFEKTKALDWIDPKLIVNKDYIFDHMLPEILNEFNQINIIKTPYKKLDCFKKIMEYINSLIKFNEGIDKEIGAEDVTPVLNYLIIKAHPERISTDIEFTKLFSENCGKFENSLVNFESICIVIISCTNETFHLIKE